MCHFKDVAFKLWILQGHQTLRKRMAQELCLKKYEDRMERSQVGNQEQGIFNSWAVLRAQCKD